MRLLVISLAALTLLACTEQEPATVEGRALKVLHDAADDFPALNATVMVDGNIVWEATAGKNLAEFDGPVLSLVCRQILTGPISARPRPGSPGFSSQQTIDHVVGSRDG